EPSPTVTSGTPTAPTTPRAGRTSRRAEPVDGRRSPCRAARSAIIRAMEPIETPAIAAVRELGVPHRVVRTEPANSAEESAQMQGIPIEALLRTIVVSRLSLPDADEAQQVTGYVRYTITPFGSTRAWPVIADAAIVEQPIVAIGGGARGVNLHLAPRDLVQGLGAEVVDVTIPDST